MPKMQGPNGEPSYGWTDKDGTVHCGICDWSKRCGSMEHIEHEIVRHVQDAHGKTILYRLDDETRHRVDVPTTSDRDAGE